MTSFSGYEEKERFLKKSVSFGKVSHAYLFSGRIELGKRAMAIEFSKMLQCLGLNSGNSCGQCRPCLEMKKNCHPDFYQLDLEKEPESSQIDLIRHLSAWLKLKPILGKYKIALVNKFQQFSLPAQSALLKTLEEPRGNAVLILICDYPELVLKTILSRVQEIRFNPLPQSRIVSLLTLAGANRSLAERIAPLSMGKLLRSKEFLNSLKISQKEKEITAFRELLNSDLASWFKAIEKMAKTDNDLGADLETWLNAARLIFLEKIISEPKSAFLPKLKKFLARLQKTNYLIITTNVNKRLLLENAALTLF